MLVACKLPNGIILEHPLNPAHTVTLNGQNSGPPMEGGGRVLIPHGITVVDDDFWNVWESSSKDFAPLKSGAIFKAPNQMDIDAIAREFAGRKTGFERKEQESGKIKKATADADA